MYGAFDNCILSNKLLLLLLLLLVLFVNAFPVMEFLIQLSCQSSDLNYCRSQYFRGTKISRIGAHVHIRDTNFGEWNGTTVKKIHELCRKKQRP